MCQVIAVMLSHEDVRLTPRVLVQRLRTGWMALRGGHLRGR